MKSRIIQFRIWHKFRKNKDNSENHNLECLFEILMAVTSKSTVFWTLRMSTSEKARRLRENPPPSSRLKNKKCKRKEAGVSEEHTASAFRVEV